MKKTFLMIVVAILFISCKKENATKDLPISLKFKANGIQYSFSGSANNFNNIGAGIITDFSGMLGNVVIPGDFCLTAYDGGSGNNANSIIIGFSPAQGLGTQISTGTYSKSNINADCQLAGKTYGYRGSCNVIIRSNANGNYSGSFTATLKELSNSNTLVLTDGTFENLPFIP